MSDTIKYLNQKELDAFFRVIKSPRDRAIFHLIYFRGLRASEPGLLELADFNADKQRLRFRRKKGSRGGEWPLHPRELTALKIWLKVRGKDAGAMFPSRNHLPISRFQVWRLMKAYAIQAGIDPRKAHTHALKHSIAMTLLREKHKDLKFIQTWMGHVNMNSTAQYLHLSDSERDSQAQELYQDW